MDDPLKARVTGAKKTFGVAPGATPPNKVTVGPATPPADPLTKFPPGVAAELRQLGYRDGDPLPERLGEELSKLTTDSGHLPSQEEFRALLYRLDAQEREALHESRAAAAMTPEIRAAYEQAQQAGEFWKVTCSPETAAAPEAPPVAASPRPAEAPGPEIAGRVPTPSHDAAGAAGGRTVCPHCLWDLRRDDVLEVDDADKAAFIEAWIPGRPFLKQYDLFGNRVAVRFRTLRRRETDAIWEWIADHGRAHPDDNFLAWEQMAQRARLFLSTVSVHVRNGIGDTNWPDGLDALTAPDARLTWATRLGLDKDTTRNPGTPEYRQALFEGIDQALSQSAFGQETQLRTLDMAHRGFSRLVARLEAMTANPDFWPPID